MLSRKNLSKLAIALIVVIVVAILYFFLQLQKGTYPASSFESMKFKWGTGDTLLNSYDSATGKYQYLDQRDSLITKYVKLRANNVIFLHNESNELGFWQLPKVIANAGTAAKSDRILRYEMEFKYEGGLKKVTYFSNYAENSAIAASADQLQLTIKHMLDEMEERYGR